NSMGINFSNDNELKAAAEAVNAKAGPWTAAPLVPGAAGAASAATVTVTNPAARRAAILEHAADQLEARRGEFLALCVREAGKSLPDAIAEVREAADFLR